MPDVAVIGLGATGAAMGRALRASGAAVAGYDPHPPTARRAAQSGAADFAAPSLEKAVAGARIILLATPLAETRDALAALGSLAPRNAVVTDACILKAPVMEWAREHLPQGVPFVGGHPILRGANDANANTNETSPLAGAAYAITAGADANETSPLAGAAYAITADADAPPDAVDAVAALARAVGAEPFFVDAAEHDSFVIATEFLPRIAAAAAIDAATTAPAWRDAHRVSGATLQNAIRAAELDPAELAIAMQCAPDALRARLDGLSAEIDAIKALAADGAEADWERTAQRLAEQAAARRARLADAPSAPHSPPLERPSLSSLILGDWLGGARRRGGLVQRGVDADSSGT